VFSAEEKECPTFCCTGEGPARQGTVPPQTPEATTLENGEFLSELGRTSSAAQHCPRKVGTPGGMGGS